MCDRADCQRGYYANGVRVARRQEDAIPLILADRSLSFGEKRCNGDVYACGKLFDFDSVLTCYGYEMSEQAGMLPEYIDMKKRDGNWSRAKKGAA